MRTTITDAHLTTYQRDGFVKVENLLDAAELDELRAAVARGVEGMGKKKLNSAHGWVDDGDTYYDRVFVQKINLWKSEPTVKRYMLGPEIGTIASALAGARLRVWHDQTLQKAPWANPTAWHLDNPYWSFHSPNAISIWIALDDATLQNGCMHYLPGSHRLVTFENVGIGADMGALFEVYPGLKGIDAVAVPMKAGDCAFHHGLTAHAAGPNMTPRWRRAMTCAYMPAGATFNGQGNILSPERLAGLKVGDSLDDDVENPLLPVLEPALA
jgi:ectoine hydroxylase-related dioxygenase (phytanoyl-CoA dioxygenase family)